MKNIILTFLVLAFWTASAQKLKEFHPKVISWDISDTARNEFEQAEKLFTELNQNEKEYEKLTAAEMYLWGTYSGREAFLETEAVGCSWYCGAEIDSAFCSSQLPDYNDITYGAVNIHDFSSETAWVEGVKGYGTGEKISISFPPDNEPVTAVRICNGYMKTEKTWHENSRVKTLKMYVNNKPYAMLHLEDVIGRQDFLIDTFKPDGKKSLVLTFEIREVYKGSKYAETAISEINFDGTGVHCFAAGTPVTMADGTVKPIEMIAVNDNVLTYDFVTKTTKSGSVIATNHARHHNLVHIETKNGKTTVTNDHPFYVEGKGWCAVNPQGAKQYAGMAAVQTMQAGDKVLLLINGNMEPVEVLSIQPIKVCLPTYTITGIEGGNCFFANGMLVATE